MIIRSSATIRQKYNDIADMYRKDRRADCPYQEWRFSRYGY